MGSACLEMFALFCWERWPFDTDQNMRITCGCVSSTAGAVGVWLLGAALSQLCFLLPGLPAPHSPVPISGKASWDRANKSWVQGLQWIWELSSYQGMASSKAIHTSEHFSYIQKRLSVYNQAQLCWHEAAFTVTVYFAWQQVWAGSRVVLAVQSTNPQGGNRTELSVSRRACSLFPPAPGPAGRLLFLCHTEFHSVCLPWVARIISELVCWDLTN